MVAMHYKSRYGDEYCIDGDKVCIKVDCYHCGPIWVQAHHPHICPGGGTLTASLWSLGGHGEDWGWKITEVKKCGGED